jgi:hypothetical protein
MALTKKEVAQKVKTRAHDRLIEARHVLKAMGLPASISNHELAQTATTLAMEAEELQCHKDIAAFFNSVASSAETLIVSELLTRTRKSKLYKDNSRDGGNMRKALRKENMLKAKMARGWRSITHTAEDLAKRRDELNSFRAIIAREKSDTTARNAKQQQSQSQSQSQSIHKHRGRQDEKTIQSALKVLIAMDPAADPRALEKKIRETMKPA